MLKGKYLQNIYKTLQGKTLAQQDIGGSVFKISFYHIPFPWKGSGQHAVIKLWDGMMSKNLSCDWSMRISLVIFVVLPLVRIY